MEKNRRSSKLAVILHADIAGSTTLVQLDEHLAHERIQDAFRRFRETIDKNHGRVRELRGDALLAEFERASDAVSAALAFQDEQNEHIVTFNDNIRPTVRVGIAMGEVIIADNTVTGAGVVLAQRVEQLAKPGGVCVTAAIHEALPQRMPFDLNSLGEQDVKGFDEQVRVYTVGLSPDAVLPKPEALLQTEAEALEIPEKPSIAVLPFTNLSDDREQDYFADGIVDSITTTLSRIKTFFVIARTSAFIFKDQAVTFEKVRDVLGVRYFLEGSVQKVANRVRINVQLIETDSGAHVWADKYDGALSDIFDLQDKIIEQVAGAMHPNILQAEIDRSRHKRPQDLGAYDYVMRSVSFVWALNQNDNQEAIRLLQLALEIDPDYSLALSLMAWCHGQQAIYNWSSTLVETKVETLRLAKLAASLNGDDSLVLTVLGAAYSIINDHNSAKVLLERAVSLDPNSAWAWSRLGWSKCYSGMPREAIDHFETALRLSPYDPMNFNCYIGIGTAYKMSRDIDKSILYLERGLNENAEAIWAYRQLAPAYMEAGRTEDAENGVRLLLQTYPNLTATKVREAMVLPDVEMNWICDNLVKAGLPE
jgi:adenylate cyclase